MPKTYLTFSERFPGTEFDWFALDMKGNIGLFSSAGFGPVPEYVRYHFQAHDQAASHVDTSTSDPWKVYAKHGLFVFDWQHWEGPYLKMEAPMAKMEAAFQQQIIRIPHLIMFNVAFEEMESIAVEQGS